MLTRREFLTQLGGGLIGILLAFLGSALAKPNRGGPQGIGLQHCPRLPDER